MSFKERLAHESLSSLLSRCLPAEVGAVLATLRAGQVDGDDGMCCFIGIVARQRGTIYTAVGLTCRATWPFEAWLRQIHFGDTPQNNIPARLLEQWLLEWLDPYILELQPVRQEAPV